MPTDEILELTKKVIIYSSLKTILAYATCLISELRVRLYVVNNVNKGVMHCYDETRITNIINLKPLEPLSRVCKIQELIILLLVGAFSSIIG